ncbi:Small heat shock protein [hydrothermal vent metagenome]|uniref:Small heat shock protein n=1 Tax=hydrothermal vent metagenome TaxID=652676 RepID=A0A3B0T2P8_9ZZZZ
MTRMTPFSSPYLLGFEQIEAMLDRIAKTAGDNFPPYNIERFETNNGSERLRIVLAVAGFRAHDLDVTLEGSTLTIAGALKDDSKRDFLHRGIAARRFVRKFVLAEGMDVEDAEVENGLLAINLTQPLPQNTVRNIQVTERD